MASAGLAAEVNRHRQDRCAPSEGPRGRARKQDSVRACGGTEVPGGGSSGSQQRKQPGRQGKRADTPVHRGVFSVYSTEAAQLEEIQRERRAGEEKAERGEAEAAKAH